MVKLPQAMGQSWSIPVEDIRGQVDQMVLIFSGLVSPICDSSISDFAYEQMKQNGIWMKSLHNTASLMFLLGESNLQAISGISQWELMMRLKSEMRVFTDDPLKWRNGLARTTSFHAAVDNGLVAAQKNLDDTTRGVCDTYGLPYIEHARE